MKTKLCRPILVEIMEKSTIFLSDDKTSISTMPYAVESPNSVQLILISLDPDEKIEVGDKLYYNGEIIIFEGHDKIDSIWKEAIKLKQKVIVTQSQLSPEYISKFIKEYNKGEVKNVEIEMEYINGWSKLLVKKQNDPIILHLQAKLTNGFVTIVKKELNEDWEAKLAIKNIPELPHIINSVRELRRYYIDGIQIGYNIRKNEESITSIDDKILYWAKALEHKSLSLKELVENAKFLLNKINYTEKDVEELIFKYTNDLLDSIDPVIDCFDGENAINFSKEWFNNNKK